MLVRTATRLRSRQPVAHGRLRAERRRRSASLRGPVAPRARTGLDVVLHLVLVPAQPRDRLRDQDRDQVRLTDATARPVVSPPANTSSVSSALRMPDPRRLERQPALAGPDRRCPRGRARRPRSRDTSPAAAGRCRRRTSSGGGLSVRRLSRASSRPRPVARPWALRRPALRRSRNARPACKVSCTCAAHPQRGWSSSRCSHRRRPVTCRGGVRIGAFAAPVRPLRPPGPAASAG